ncbi:MAG: peptide chain release factor 2 [bacterium]
MSENLENLKEKILSTMKLLKIEDLKKKAKQLSEQMNARNFWDNQQLATAISQDYQDIITEVNKWEDLLQKTNDLLELSQTQDQSIADEIEFQSLDLKKQFEDYEFFLLLNGPYDKNNAIIAIHAGSGGTEAQDWAEMLLRMVLRFSEKQGWKAVIVDESRGSEAGYKSVMLRIAGRYAYGYLKSENGVHRLVRISPFDAEKMRHTSFALIEVLPELEESAEIEIEPKDLRIDTFNASGAGGQSVNTAYSAVRIVHIPTKITVSCQNERSQKQNKETAMKILISKLHQLELEKKAQERQDLRGEFKSAEWGNQIRSYVLHPYHMVKDHRTDYESADPESVLEGDLLKLSEAYLRWKKE